MDETTHPVLASHLDVVRPAANRSGLIRALRSERDAWFSDVIDCVIEQVPAYSNTANPSIRPQLEQHIHAHIEAVIGHLDTGSSRLDVAFVESHTRWLAEQYFPLEALLHAYRCFMKVTRDRYRQYDAEAGLTDYLIEYVNLISSTASAHYTDQSRLLADVASDRRSELLQLLLEGVDESNARVLDKLKQAGYRERNLSFVVVLAQSTDPTEMQHPDRARRLADTIDKALSGIPGKRLVDIHRNKVTMIFSHLRRVSGWSAPQSSLAKKLVDELLAVGPAARIGVSNDVPSISHIPSAYREAELAFDHSGLNQRVVQYSSLSMSQILMNLAGAELTGLLPPWAEAFSREDNKSKTKLSKTLYMYADADMNAIQAAKQLQVHPNTLYARFDRISSVTGLDPRRFHDLCEILMVCTAISRRG